MPKCATICGADGSTNLHTQRCAFRTADKLSKRITIFSTITAAVSTAEWQSKQWPHLSAHGITFSYANRGTIECTEQPAHLSACECTDCLTNSLAYCAAHASAVRSPHGCSIGTAKRCTEHRTDGSAHRSAIVDAIDRTVCTACCSTKLSAELPADKHADVRPDVAANYNTQCTACSGAFQRTECAADSSTIYSPDISTEW